MKSMRVCLGLMCGLPFVGGVAATQVASASATRPAWTQNYEEAKREAKATGKPILALFTGSDWCPPCKEFERDVAGSRTFLGYAWPRVVLLKLEYPQHMLQSPELIAQNAALAQRIGGREFPRFYLLDAEGEVLTKLDLSSPAPGAKTYEDFILHGLREALAVVAAKRR